jgi:hypothetical protein
VELDWIVRCIRRRWPDVQILVRGDSGFAREALMRWCEDHGVDYVFGLAKNARLLAMIKPLAERVRRKACRRGEAVRHYKELRYRTLDSWSRTRRVVAKAEHLAKGANPRFVVTSLSKEAFKTRALYEDLYCARGEMENRIKEQQLDLFADRTSCQQMKANQLRLYVSSMAYVVLTQLRNRVLKGTSWARARADTLRLRLLKIGALVKPTVRRFWIHFSSSYPHQEEFIAICQRLQSTPLRR